MIKELEQALDYLRTFVKRAMCLDMPTVVLEFERPGDRARFMAQAANDMAVLDALNPNTSIAKAQLALVGIVMKVRTRDDIALRLQLDELLKSTVVAARGHDITIACDNIGTRNKIFDLLVET